MVAMFVPCSSLVSRKSMLGISTLLADLFFLQDTLVENHGMSPKPVLFATGGEDTILRINQCM